MTSRDNEILFLSAIDALRNITVVSTNLRKDLKQNILESIENLIKVHNNVNNELFNYIASNCSLKIHLFSDIILLIFTSII